MTKIMVNEGKGQGQHVSPVSSTIIIVAKHFFLPTEQSQAKILADAYFHIHQNDPGDDHWEGVTWGVGGSEGHLITQICSFVTRGKDVGFC